MRLKSAALFFFFLSSGSAECHQNIIFFYLNEKKIQSGLQTRLGILFQPSRRHLISHHFRRLPTLPFDLVDTGMLGGCLYASVIGEDHACVGLGCKTDSFSLFFRCSSVSEPRLWRCHPATQTHTKAADRVSHHAFVS